MMTDTIDHPLVVESRRPQLWQMSGVVFVGLSLLGLAAGTFPDRLLPLHSLAAANPPALAALLAVQASLMLLLAPLVAMRLGSTGSQPVALAGSTGFQPVPLGGSTVDAWVPKRHPPYGLPTPPARLIATLAGRQVLWIIASAPLYLAGAWFADATAADVLRALVYLAGVSVAGLGLSLWAASGRNAIAAAVVLLALTVTAILPVLTYLAKDVAEAWALADALWQASCATFPFTVAASHAPQWYPTPLWPAVAWPVAGLILIFSYLVVRPGRKRQDG
jgi:hypothetical protein